MRKIYLGLIIGLFLIGTIYAVSISKSIDVETDTQNALIEKGITAPEISECIKIDDFTCRAKVFQKGGINTDLVIEYHFCSEYEEVEEVIEGLEGEENEIMTTSVCKTWTTLKQLEIETALTDKLQVKLEKIADVHIARNEEPVLMSDKLDVTISSK